MRTIKYAKYYHYRQTCGIKQTSIDFNGKVNNRQGKKETTKSRTETVVENYTSTAIPVISERAPTPRIRSSLFSQGSRCSLRHALAPENFPPPREMRLTSRHRPMLLAVSASPDQATSQPTHPPLPPPADSKQIFYRRENKPSAFPTKTCKPSPTKPRFSFNSRRRRERNEVKDCVINYRDI